MSDSKTTKSGEQVLEVLVEDSAHSDCERPLGSSGEYDLTLISSEDAEFLVSYPKTAHKKILRKMDWRIVPVLAMLYFLAILDRNNIANAKIEGMEEELQLYGSRYNVALCVFYPTYILAAHVKRPSWYLGGLTFSWGLVATMHGFIQSYEGLVAARIVLGALEGGLYPAGVYLISVWYLPRESQTRLSGLYFGNGAAGAISGLLAYAIAHMEGIGGFLAWRWIFIVEGLASVIVGICGFALLPDSPAQSRRWLRPEEIRYLEVRQRATPGRKSHGREREVSEEGKGAKYIALLDRDSWKMVWSAVSAWNVFAMGLIYMCFSAPTVALKFNLPQIVRDMGTAKGSASIAQLLTIPPFAMGLVATFGLAQLWDRYKLRRLDLAIGCGVMTVVAHAVLFAYSPTQDAHIGETYFAICLAAAGMFTIIPTLESWLIANLAPARRRSVGIGYYVCWGNVGSIIGTFMYRDSEAPTYPTGYGTAFSLAGLGVVLACFVEWRYWRINRKRQKLSKGEILSTYTEEELDVLGDRSPLFRYSY
ncbi:hypothetical protein N0V82_008231 [Gnomoniopsis sp. IMI 355080]|nr:hypothetical protein N0V82_008231 [Gnomoniopsis sp. IMI 355080]